MGGYNSIMMSYVFCDWYISYSDAYTVSYQYTLENAALFERTKDVSYKITSTTSTTILYSLHFNQGYSLY